MPQINKGGKYVFGAIDIGGNGEILVPPEAMQEYGFHEGDTVILMSGSRTSGGFVLTSNRLIRKSKISSLIDTMPELKAFSLPEAGIVRNGRRALCWTMIKESGYIILPLETLTTYDLQPGDRLVAVRGSNIGITFMATGPVWQRATAHPMVANFKA